MTLQEATNLFSRLKDAYNKKDYAGAEACLSQLKLKLIQLPAIPPAFGESPTKQQELLLAREVLEHAVLLSLQTRNEAAMERAFAQLQTYYADTRSLLPPSPQEVPMAGLNLLRLLVQNRISEFHTELELIPSEAHSDINIRTPVQLEQWLMEGAYNKVLDASKQHASDLHAALLSQLTSTVRDEVASCSEKAYERLRLTDAARMMMLGTEAQAREYAQKHGWAVDGAYIIFPREGAASAAAAGDSMQVDGPAATHAHDVAVGSMGLINQALTYAKELERIV